MEQVKRVTYKPVADVIDDASAMIDPLPANGKSRLARLLPGVIRDFKLHVNPSYRTIKMTLESNSTIPMPSDTVRPVKVFLLKCAGPHEILLQFGYWHKYTPSQVEMIDCSVSEDEVKNCNSIELPNYKGAMREFYHKNIFYGENYGSKYTRFFGMYSYIEIENRLEITGGAVGDHFIIVYESKEADYSMVAEHTMNAMINRILSKYYKAANPALAQTYHLDFLRDLGMVRKYNDRLSYEDYLDSITSEYTNKIR